MQNPDNLFIAAVNYHKNKNFAVARQLYNELLRLDPNNIRILTNMGLLYKQQGDFTKAISLYQQALAIKPAPSVYGNLGSLYTELKNFSAAKGCFIEATKLAPGHLSYWVSLGMIEVHMRNFTGAINCFQKALKISPDKADVHCLYANVLLKSGNLSKGFEEYEWRMKKSNISEIIYSQFAKVPRWNGDMFPSKNLVVYSEQGFGDTLQFVRYLSMVKKRGGKIIFYTHPTFHRLFKNLPFIDELPEVLHLSTVDFAIPLMSLPLIFETTLNTIPARIPYLTVEQQLIEEWKQYTCKGSFKVGLVWSGNTYDNIISDRSASLDDFLPLFSIKNVTYYSLQKSSTHPLVQVNNLHDNLIDFMAQVKDFADTASIISNLDLVISIDTSVAHLAGALGKPVWVLLPYESEWRWLTEIENTPWYSTMRLFRQSATGDWLSVIQRVATALGKIADNL